MSIIKNHYDTDKSIDYTWYNSSNVLFSKCEDHKSALKTLWVVFKNNVCYKYSDVNVQDYLMFRSGGTDGSQGKALNFFIKNKYNFENVGTVPNDFFDADLIIPKKEIKEKIYFISGHRDLTKDEFDLDYAPVIKKVVEDEDTQFVIGDYNGCDIMAQNYLINELNINPNRITVYHMYETPRNINEKITNLVGGFKTDRERDGAMTNISQTDIAFVKTSHKISGTGENILRRHELTIIKNKENNE